MSGIPEPIPVSYSGMSEETRRNARFTELVKRHSLFVFRVAFSVMRNAADAEEVVQETFLKVYRSDALDRMQDERAFLARTAWRVAQDRRPRTVSVVFGDDIVTSSPNPEDVAIDGDLNTSLHRLIDSLPDHLRQPLALSAIQEMTSPEIAQAMGIAEGTVRTRLLRARQILREKLEALMGNKAR